MNHPHPASGRVWLDSLRRPHRSLGASTSRLRPVGGGVVVGLSALVAGAAEGQEWPSAMELEASVRVYVMTVGGTPTGEVTLSIARELDGDEAIIRVTEQSPTAMEQSTVFTAADFTPLEVVTARSGSPIVELRLEEGRIVGRTSLPGRPPEEVDEAVPTGTLLPGMEVLFVALSELRLGVVLEIQNFVPTIGLATTTATVVGQSEVEVPAGRFEVLEVEMSGQVSSRLFLRRDFPHLLVRQELVGPFGQAAAVELREVR